MQATISWLPAKENYGRENLTYLSEAAVDGLLTVDRIHQLHYAVIILYLAKTMDHAPYLPPIIFMLQLTIDYFGKDSLLTENDMRQHRDRRVEVIAHYHTPVIAKKIYTGLSPCFAGAEVPRYTINLNISREELKQELAALE